MTHVQIQCNCGKLLRKLNDAFAVNLFSSHPAPTDRVERVGGGGIPPGQGTHKGLCMMSCMLAPDSDLHDSHVASPAIRPSVFRSVPRCKAAAHAC